jgi:hypothetical protein
LFFRFIGRQIGRTIGIPDIMLYDRYNIAMQIYSFRIIYFFLEYSDYDKTEFLIILGLKCFIKIFSYVMEAVALRGLM